MSISFKATLTEQLRLLRAQDHTAGQLRLMQEYRSESLKEFKKAHHMNVVNKNKVDVYV